MSRPPANYRAVIFDVGGVIVGSPLDAIVVDRGEQTPTEN